MSRLSVAVDHNGWPAKGMKSEMLWLGNGMRRTAMLFAVADAGQVDQGASEALS